MAMLPGCDDDSDPLSASLDEARARLLESVRPIAKVEDCEPLAALGQCLAEAVVARQDVPAHDNSAMDGFALRLADLTDEMVLPVAGTNLAGKPVFTELPANACVRIMTGAMLPAGADAVVMQEQVSVREDGLVVFPQVSRGSSPTSETADSLAAGAVIPAIKSGQNIRRAGEDIQSGATLLPAGTLIGPAEVGVLCAQGLQSVRIRRRPRVAVLVTGDELVQPGKELASGELYDSNRPMLLALLQACGCEPVDMGVAADNAEDLRTRLQKVQSADVDALITTGGVSVGEADLVRDAIQALGSLRLWRVAIKPGRPFAFGQLPSNAGPGNAGLGNEEQDGEAIRFFGLPGNPVSAMVTFQLLVQPALAKMAGRDWQPPAQIAAMTAGALRKRPGRMEFQRGWLEATATGHRVTAIKDQGSGRLTSMVQANCLIVLDTDCAGVADGELVSVLPLHRLSGLS